MASEILIPTHYTFRIKSALLIPVTYTGYGWLTKQEIKELV